MAIVESIVTEAIFLSLQDRALQPDVDPTYLEGGLRMLNILLDEWRSLIPWAQQAIFTNVDNLEQSQFVQIETVNFVINNNSTILLPASLIQFRQLKSVIGLTGVPTVYYFDQLNQAIEVYPKPSMPNYQFIVWGRIAMAVVGMFDNIPANIPPFMQSAIEYELAFRLCGYYGTPWDPSKDETRKTKILSLKNKKAIDLTQPINIVFGNPGIGNVPPFPYLYYLSGGQ